MAIVMGIVNVTPDSFSDGGKYCRPEEAVRRARNMVADGARIIDFGAESTRPGATPLSWQEEWERLEPVLAAWRQTPESKNADVPTSIDTYHVETAQKSLEYGAGMINCVYGDNAEEMLSLCETTKASLILPASCLPQIEAHGTWCRERVYIDPMIGFGTTRDEDLAMLRGIGDLAKRWPVAVGASRKRIVKKLTGEKLTGKNLGGNLAIAIWCAMAGASIIRVHDVKETVQALKVMRELA